MHPDQLTPAWRLVRALALLTSAALSVCALYGLARLLAMVWAWA